MRTPGLILAAAALAGATAIAQSPKPAKPTDPTLPAAPVMSEANQKALDQFLGQWEARMTDVEGLQAKCALTTTTLDDFGKPESRIATGEVQLLKPNLARLFLRDAADPTDLKRVKHLVSDGKSWWEFNHAKKVATVSPLPAGRGNTLLTFLFGGKAADLKDRYHLAVDVGDPKKYTENYICIAVLPRTRADFQEFKKAELVLWANRKDPKYADQWMLPARLWFQQFNGDQVTWQFDGPTTKVKLTAKDFAGGPPGKDWKVEGTPGPAPGRPVSGGRKD
jgi:TIGR03009 family protein